MKLSIHIRREKVQSDIVVGPISRQVLRRAVERYSLGNYAFLITNETVYRLYRVWIRNVFAGIPHTVFTLPDSERAKSLPSLCSLVRALGRIDAPLGRNVFCVCVGGGVVGDAGGLAASLYRRGIPYLSIPTTLLAQIDSSIGGKVAVNIAEGKNLVGAFYHPCAVLIDPSFLHTLTRAQLREGLAEAVKYGVIADTRLFSLLSGRSPEIFSLEKKPIEEIIARCLRIKSAIVSKDEREVKSLRTVLNFGHTIGHALETCFSYSHLSHGSAISVGMAGACFISRRMGLCDKRVPQKVEALLLRLGLPARIALKHKMGRALHALFYDKKFIRGTIRMVLVEDIGKVRVVDKIKPGIVKEALRYLSAKV